MHNGNHALTRDFPELKDRIQELRQSDNHFKNLEEKYNALDVEIAKDVSGEQPLSEDHLEDLKRQRVVLKDELYTLLTKETA